MDSNAQMRYQLPGDPNKILSGGRQEKEVKWRTKTGCLTCQKRRIKVRNLNGLDLQPMFRTHSEARAIIVCGNRGRTCKVNASLVLPTHKRPIILGHI
jgi:hypothetical protein